MRELDWASMDFNNVEPPDEPEIPADATCADCRLFDPCPCGCGHGPCRSWGQWTEGTYSGRDCGMWEEALP